MSIDDFRDAGAFIEDDEDETPSSAEKKRPSSRGGGGAPVGALGLTAVQRFILSLLLLMMACLLGTFFLIATGRVIPPGLF